MKKIFSISVFVVIFALIISTGCQSPDETAKANFLINGQLSSQLSRGPATSIPHEYQVVVTKFELLRSENDQAPVVVYDAGESYALVNLTADAPTGLGAGEIQPGTYPYCRATLIAISQQVDVYSPGNTNDHIHKTYIKAFQDIDNSNASESTLPAALISLGDVLVSEEGIFSWFQIDETKVYTYSATRSDVTAYQVTITPGEEIRTIQFTSPLTIEEGKRYSSTLIFNVDNTFEWEDSDSDGKFEPTSGDHSGAMNGFTFDVLNPLITATATEIE